MPEWNLVVERQKLSSNKHRRVMNFSRHRLYRCAVLVVLVGAPIAIALSSLTGCSKLRVPTDYSSTDFGNFTPPTTNAQNTATTPPASSATPSTPGSMETPKGLEEVVFDSIEVKATAQTNEVAPTNSEQPLAISTSNDFPANVQSTNYEAALQPQDDQPTELDETDEPSAPRKLVARVGTQDTSSLSTPLNPIRTLRENASSNESSFGSMADRPIALAPRTVEPVSDTDPSQAGQTPEKPIIEVPVDAMPSALKIMGNNRRLEERVEETAYVNEPLRPMLFDAQTRQQNPDYNKTLREPTIQQQMEKRVALQTRTRVDSKIIKLTPTVSNEITPLTPSNQNMNASGLRKPEFERGFRTTDTRTPKTTDSGTLSISRPDETLSAEVSMELPPPFAEAPPMDTDNLIAIEPQPIVDQSAFILATPLAKPARPAPQPVAEPAVMDIPGEVVTDVPDVEPLIDAEFAKIDQMIDDANANLVQVSNVENSPVCDYCQNQPMVDGCPNCSEGTPLKNNDFAVSDVPTAREISPMVIPPTGVPGPPASQNTPTDFQIQQSPLPAPGEPVSSPPTSSSFQPASFARTPSRESKATPVVHPAEFDGPTEITYDANSISSDPPFVAPSPASLMIDTIAPGPVASDIPPVGVDALMALNNVTWQTRLDQTISLIDRKLKDQNTDDDTRTGLEINLRLLQVLRRQITNVAQSSSKLEANEQQFWNHQLDAITTMIDSTDETQAGVSDLIRHQTAHHTLAHLRQAVERLETIANLKVSAGQFCTEITGFGQYKVFPENSFAPGQRTLVYCEVQNYLSREQPTAAGAEFITKLRGSFAVYDQEGNAVQQAEFPVVEDVARNRRRDFYMYLPVTIGQLAPGNYRIHVLVEDIHGNKSASLENPIDFLVR